MQNVVINMCEKFHYDWLRNDRALGNGKSDNNKNNNNNNKNYVRSHWGPVWSFPGPKNFCLKLTEIVFPSDFGITCSYSK